MAISTGQWEAIEEHLKGFFSCCEFRIQGHDIKVVRKPYDEGEMWLHVYIDGEITLENGWPYHDDFNPLVKDLWRLVATRVHSIQHKQNIEQLYGLRKAKKAFPNLDDVMETWEPTFPKAHALVKQLRRVEGLELVKIDAIEVAPLVY